MEIGHLNQKAPSLLAVFVFSCIIVVIGLLYVKVKAESTAGGFYEDLEFGQY